MFGFTNLSVHHSNGDDVVYFGFCQLRTHADRVPMLNPTTSVVDNKDNATMSMVSDNRVKTGITFAYIVCGNQSPKSVIRVNPVITAQNKHVSQKKHVTQFTIAWWNLHLDS